MELAPHSWMGASPQDLLAQYLGQLIDGVHVRVRRALQSLQLCRRTEPVVSHKAAHQITRTNPARRTPASSSDSPSPTRAAPDAAWPRWPSTAAYAARSGLGVANVTGEARGIKARGKGAPRPGPHLTAEGVAQLAQFPARLAECGEWRPPPPTMLATAAHRCRRQIATAIRRSDPIRCCAPWPWPSNSPRMPGRRNRTPALRERPGGSPWSGTPPGPPAYGKGQRRSLQPQRRPLDVLDRAGVHCAEEWPFVDPAPQGDARSLGQ